MDNYYKHIKNTKVKKVILAQMIIMWVPIMGSIAATIMMQFVLYKRNPEKIAKFDLALIIIIVILIAIYFAFTYFLNQYIRLQPGTAALIYIAALLIIGYFAAFYGISSETKIIYDLEQGIVRLSLGAAAPAQPAVKPESRAAADAGGAVKDGAAAVKPVEVEKDPGGERVSAFPPVIERARVAQMIHADTEKALREKLPKRTKNIVGHEEKILRTLKVYMTPERKNTLSANGVSADFTLAWFLNDERARRTEILYTRPLLKQGYTCYFSLSLRRGENQNGVLFKVSEITRSHFTGARHKKYYQAEEIIKTINEYLE